MLIVVHMEVGDISGAQMRSGDFMEEEEEMAWHDIGFPGHGLLILR